MDQKRKRRQFHKILVICMAVLVVAIDILFFATPDRAVSETENRNLQLFPKLSFHTLTQGRFESQLDDYIADQFPFRDRWIGLETSVARLAGNTMSHGIFLAGDGYLIQGAKEHSIQEYDTILSDFSSVIEGHQQLAIYALIAPTAVSILHELLPANAYSGVSGDEDAFLDKLLADLTSMGITTIDVRNRIKDLYSRGVQPYYRTDHHWTTDAAYEAYKFFAQTAQLPGLDNSYDRLMVTDTFQGTLSASSGWRTNLKEPIYVFLPKEGDDTEYVMVNLDNGQKSASLYDVDYLETRDKYAMFLGGNHGEVKIQTAAGTQRSLLILKDSYANCFIPFLMGDFDTIIVVDPRYYLGDIDQIIDNEGITDILFLYNAETL